MSWNNLATVQPTENWIFTDPVIGSFFRLTHYYDPIPGAELFGWVAQAERISGGVTQLFDIQRINASRLPIIFEFQKPGCMNGRCLGFRRYRAISLNPDNWTIELEVNQPGTLLSFVSNGDTNGVFYYLGTNLGATPWSNPYPMAVGLSASSAYPAFSDISVLTGRAPACFATQNEQGALILIDLKSKRLACNMFTLCGRGDGTTVTSPRSYNLVGGNDPQNMQTLIAVQNSPLIDANTWGEFGIPLTPPYQFFGIQQAGVTSDGNDYYLALGQIELYGTLF